MYGNNGVMYSEQRINHEYWKTQNQIAIDTNRKLVETQSKIQISDNATYNQILLETHREKIRLQREMKRNSLAENEEGVLLYNREINENISESREIFYIHYLKMYQYWACGTKKKEEIWKVFWHENPEGFYMKGEEMTPKSLKLQLLKKGVNYKVAAAKRDIIADLVYSWLIEKAERIELPLAYGWNIMSSGQLIFANNDDLVLRGWSD